MSDSVVVRTQDAARKKFINGVYSWMVIALAVSGVCAFLTVSNDVILRFIFGNSVVFPLLIIGELVLVFFFSARIHKIQSFFLCIPVLQFSGCLQLQPECLRV